VSAKPSISPKSVSAETITRPLAAASSRMVRSAAVSRPHHRREQPRTLTCPGKSPFTCIQPQAGDSAPPSHPSTHRYSTSENSAESSRGLFGAVPPPTHLHV